MTTKNKQSDVLSIASNISRRASIHAALLADVVSVISEMINERITLIQRNHDGDEPVICFTIKVERIIGKPPRTSEQFEHYIFIPSVSTSNLDRIRIEIAHELGHLLFRSPACDIDSDSLSQKEVEVLADTFALAIVNYRGRVKEREEIINDRPQDLVKMFPNMSKKTLSDIINKISVARKAEHKDSGDA